MNKRIELYDVTPRDGDQADGINMGLDDKVRFARLAAELGFDYVEGGYPLSNEIDRELFRVLRNESLGNTTLTAFGMTRRKGVMASHDKGLLALLRAETSALTVVGKSSRFQAKHVLKVGPNENLDMIAESMEYLASHRGDLTYDAEHFFDGWKEDPAYALKTLEAALSQSKGKVRRVVLCDTNGGSPPELVRKATRAVIKHLGNTLVGIHPHNDRGLATANMRAAVHAGARHIQGTWNGHGERTGNLDLCEAIGNLYLDGCELPSSLPERLTEISNRAARILQQESDPSQPFVGSRAFTHKGGMHAHSYEAYEFVPPETFGNVRRIVGSKQSGLSNIRAIVQRSQAISPELRERVLGNVAEQEKILAAMKEREKDGFAFDRADASAELLALHAIDAFTPTFQITRAPTVTDTFGKPAEATIKVRVNGDSRDEHQVAEGEGPVDALSNAMTKALLKKFPCLKILKLTKFRIQMVPGSNEGTASVVRVSADFTNGSDSWSTTGASTDMIVASFQAVSDGFEYFLLRNAHPDLASASTSGSAV